MKFTDEENEIVESLMDSDEEVKEVSSSFPTDYEPNMAGAHNIAVVVIMTAVVLIGFAVWAISSLAR